LANDREAHYDFLRAMEVIAEIPNATLEKGAHLLRMCRSWREKKGGGFEAPRNRQVELDPRVFLLCQNEAHRLGQKLGDVVNGALMEWANGRVSALLREREQSEAEKKLEAMKKVARERARAYNKTRASRKAIREDEAIARMIAEVDQKFARMAEKTDGNGG
jgi:hypothetical protein